MWAPNRIRRTLYPRSVFDTFAMKVDEDVQGHVADIRGFVQVTFLSVPSRSLRQVMTYSATVFDDVEVTNNLVNHRRRCELSAQKNDIVVVITSDLIPFTVGDRFQRYELVFASRRSSFRVAMESDEATNSTIKTLTRLGALQWI
jgi:hypothetical protein